MSQFTTTVTEARAQPWQAMQEVQSLFKPEAAANADKIEEEPLKLNLFRTNLNAATTNIANVEEAAKTDKPEAAANNDKIEEEPLKLNLFRTNLNAATTNIADVKEE